jgi:tetratricopeptide (TPR) repeat protein
MVHPLQTECVAYVSQRSESLMTLCYLATLLASIRAWDARRARAWAAVAAACCAAGMASKEAMVTAPVAVVLWDAVFAGGPPRRLLRERGALYGMLASSWLVLAGLMAGGHRVASVGFGLGVSALDWIENQCVVVLDYLRLVVWPHPLVLDYGYPRELSRAEVLPRAALLALLVLAALLALWRRPAVGFAAAWPFLLLAPTSSFVPIVTEVGAERRMHLALAGPVVLGVTGVAWLLARRAPDDARYRLRLGVAAVLVVALPLAARTVLRLGDYESAVVLWSTSVEARPDNHRALGNLAKALWEQDRLDEALVHARRAVELRPDYAEGWNTLGSTLWAQGRRAEALEHWQRALATWPTYPDAHYNLATALQAERRLDEAVAHYREALRTSPGHARAHNNLGTALASLGQLEEAIAQFREALRLEPEYEAARRNLERALARSSGG